MQPETIDTSADTLGFFADVPIATTASGTFDPTRYRPAPDDWSIAITDVVNSSKAIAEGRHKDVNVAAAASIAALKNLCAPISVPLLFGGDGAVVLVPKPAAAEARRLLARLRGFAARELDLILRVGLVAVADVRRHGSDVLVGRFQPSPGNEFGVFMGGGVGLVEAAMKAEPPSRLANLAAVPDTLDDGAVIDMAGLSCRWDALSSTRGSMVTLIIQDAVDLGGVYTEVMRLAAADGDPRPARPATLKASWPPRGFLLEARTRRAGRSLALSTAKVLAEMFIARLVVQRRRPTKNFDPVRYREEIATNTDFCKQDDTLSLVVDCAPGAIEAIRQLLESQAAQGKLRYGMHLSPTALMTCLVSSATENRHIHFIDGGDGGYTSASKRLKGAAS